MLPPADAAPPPPPGSGAAAAAAYSSRLPSCWRLWSSLHGAVPDGGAHCNNRGIAATGSRHAGGKPRPAALPPLSRTWRQPRRAPLAVPPPLPLLAAPPLLAAAPRGAAAAPAEAARLPGCRPPSCCCSGGRLSGGPTLLTRAWPLPPCCRRAPRRRAAAGGRPSVGVRPAAPSDQEDCGAAPKAMAEWVSARIAPRLHLGQGQAQQAAISRGRNQNPAIQAHCTRGTSPCNPSPAQPLPQWRALPARS